MRHETRGILAVLFFVLSLVAAGPSAAQVPPERADALRAMAEKLQPAVERIRGLEFVRDVPKGVKTEAELREFIEGEMNAEMPPEEVKRMEKVLSTVGLIPEDLDLTKLYVELLTEQIAGFYDPRTKQLYLIDRTGKPSDNAMLEAQRQMFKMMGTSEEEIYMAHELVHALEDQHFELLSLNVDDLQDDDRALASKTLVEGTATVLMFDYMLGKMGMDSSMLKSQQDLLGGGGMSGSEVLDKAPEYVKQGLMFPYMQGLKFVLEIKEAGGWKAVDEVFQDPPASTEQTLHPEKYTGAKRDNPMLLVLPDVSSRLGEGWSVVGHNTLGELGLRILLGEKVAKKAAERAAAGWDGDQYAVYEGPGGQRALVLASTWDTEKDANEFAKTYGDFLVKRHSPANAERSDAGVSWTQDGRHTRLVVEGTDCLAVIGVPESAADGLIEALASTPKTEWAGGLPPAPAIESAPGTTPARSGAGSGSGAQKIEIATPEGWTRTTDAEGVTLKHETGARITLKRMTLPDMPQDILVSHVAGSLSDRITDYRPQGEVASIQLAGLDASSIRFQGMEDGVAQVYELVIFKVADDAVLVHFATPGTAAADTQPGWIEVKESLTVR